MTDRMRLAWPVVDKQVPRLHLIDEAIADVPNILARLGYTAAGLPHDFELTGGQGIPGLRERDQALTCVIDVIANTQEIGNAA